MKTEISRTASGARLGGLELTSRRIRLWQPRIDRFDRKLDETCCFRALRGIGTS
jgi:hypothetical protein